MYYGLYFLIVCLAICCLYDLFQPHERHCLKDGVYYKAWHIFGPGYIDCVWCEIKEPLKKWVGSTFLGLEVVDTKSGHNIPELEAAAALKALGLFTDLKVQLIDGEWCLFKPERTYRVWSWRGINYRISPLKIDREFTEWHNKPALVTG